jgi:hypothetical protein
MNGSRHKTGGSTNTLQCSAPELPADDGLKLSNDQFRCLSGIVQMRLFGKRIRQLAGMRFREFKASPIALRSTSAGDPDRGRWFPGRYRGAAAPRRQSAPDCIRPQVPDLPERRRAGGPFNADDPTTYYGGGEKGYTDYPSLAQDRGERPKACVNERWR